MPIYAYKCESCGFAKDVLQKMSDAPLSECPSCGAVAFRKQLTSAGFQLKGSGWYATDFKGSGAAPPPADDKANVAADAKPDTKVEAKTDTKTDTKTEAKSAVPAADKSAAKAPPAARDSGRSSSGPGAAG